MGEARLRAYDPSDKGRFNPDRPLHYDHAAAWDKAIGRHGDELGRLLGAGGRYYRKWRNPLEEVESPTERAERAMSVLQQFDDVDALAPLRALNTRLGCYPPVEKCTPHHHDLAELAFLCAEVLSETGEAVQEALTAARNQDISRQERLAVFEEVDEAIVALFEVRAAIDQAWRNQQ